MNLEKLRENLLKKCTDWGIGMVGFAPVSRWKNPPVELPDVLSPWISEDFWPQSIYPETKTVNSMLDFRAYEIANFLNEKGFSSIYLPGDGYGDIKILIEKYNHDIYH